MILEYSIDEAIATFLEAAVSSGWILQTREKAQPVLPVSIIERYSNIPNAFIEFLSIVLDAAPSDEKAWFLCEANYNGTSPTTSAWNEWELFDCDNFKDDPDLVVATKKFWDQHFPIMMSVRSDFAYIAIDMSTDHYGTIVFGYSPFLLEPKCLYAAFPDFLISLAHSITLAASGSIDNVKPPDLTDFV